MKRTSDKPPSKRKRLLGWAAQAALLVAVLWAVSAWQTRKHLGYFQGYGTDLFRYDAAVDQLAQTHNPYDF